MFSEMKLAIYAGERRFWKNEELVEGGPDEKLRQRNAQNEIR